MVGRTNVGGGNGGIVVAAWAYIGVTYPAGSVCTATNGTLTFTAEDTSGLYVFQIPQPLSTPEEWTISCTNGTRNKSATVEVSVRYQCTNVLLRYSRLPEGYQEVEYLESDGGEQYIDIFGEIVDPYAYEFELTYEKFSTNAGAICGWDNQSSTVIYIGRLIQSGSAYYTYYFGGLNEFIDSNVEANGKASVVINNANYKVIENDIEIGTLRSYSGATSRLMLFSTSATRVGVGSGTAGRVYSFSAKNKQSGVVVKNFVPCYRTSDDEAGFYDLANNTFVTNDGSGTFVVGADV